MNDNVNRSVRYSCYECGYTSARKEDFQDGLCETCCLHPYANIDPDILEEMEREE